MQNIIDRFISYVTIDTESDPNSNTTPSTKKQLVLAKLLVKELTVLLNTDIWVFVALLFVLVLLEPVALVQVVAIFDKLLILAAVTPIPPPAIADAVLIDAAARELNPLKNI